jgi:para-aminobenzoate synthetase
MNNEKDMKEYNDISVAIKNMEKQISFLPKPLIMAIDGGSGSGKTTIAKEIADSFNAVIIPLDDFFSANIPDSRWDYFTIEEKLDKVFDWDRLRKSALEPLLSGKQASWQAFDFESGVQNDGTYKMKQEFVVRKPGNIIILEGAYSSSPKIVDLLSFTVLLDLPIAKRHSRLEIREEANLKFLECWHKRWDAVEEYYFNEIRPKNFFDIVMEC